MSGFNVASHSPCQTNRFETLIRHIELLSESIMRDVRIDLSLDQLEGREHVMFTQTKSIVKIVEKLRELFQITQTPKLIDYLNESYPDQWSPSFLLKNIETSCSQANHVRMNLIDLIDRLPKFVRDVQNTLYHTLTGHSTTLVRQWIDAKALKAVQDKRHLLNQSKLQLDQLRSRLERNMNTDLQLIRFRRRESSERLYPQVNVYPLSTLNFPTVVSRT
ncbi:unnamed protein product [Echinostoma caproni]|uniref:Coiled-coil domain-containing protein 142 n=1 Tax=Echinostoma caproni TaxID=27848 RepID=A0A183A8Z8_9TREM|nr:unnamed protein product [Echinostoma caproni]